MAEDFGSWAYAVAGGMERDWLEAMTGVGGRPVHPVQAAGLSAAVTAVRLEHYGEEPLRRQLEDIGWLEATALTHHRVIETIARRTRLIPMRLATVYHSDAAVAAMLAARRDDLIAALARVAARTEWGVKIYAPQRRDTGAGPAAAAAAGPAPGSPGAAYLHRRRTELSARQDARRAALASADDIHRALGRLAAAVQLRAPQDPQLTGQPEPMMLNGAYLVDDEQSGRFTTAVQSLAERHPAVRIELTGPWPPYSFATVDEPGAAL